MIIEMIKNMKLWIADVILDEFVREDEVGVEEKCEVVVAGERQ